MPVDGHVSQDISFARFVAYLAAGRAPTYRPYGELTRRIKKRCVGVSRSGGQFTPPPGLPLYQGPLLRSTGFIIIRQLFPDMATVISRPYDMPAAFRRRMSSKADSYDDCAIVDIMP